MSDLTKQQIKEIDSVLKTLKTALPSSRTTWPNDLRKQDAPSGMGQQVIAWNGTCGANAVIGHKGYAMIKDIKRTPRNNASHKWIYIALQNKKFLDEKTRETFAVSTLQAKTEGGPWVQLGKHHDIFRTDDVALMVAIANKTKSDKVTLWAITEVITNSLWYNMYTFSVSPAITFHILSVPEKEAM